MTTDEVLKNLEDLGLKVSVDLAGNTKIIGDKSLVTSAMLKALRWHKKAIVERLRPKPLRQWLWRTGHTYQADELTPDAWHPTGAFWHRLQGETTWRAIPERNEAGYPIPDGEREAA